MKEYVNFEVVVKTIEGQSQSMFDENTSPAMGNIQSFRSNPDRSVLVARKLANLGVTVHDVGEFSISATCKIDQFEILFSTKLTEQPWMGEGDKPEDYQYLAASDDAPWKLPNQEGLDELIENVYTQPDPILFLNERSIPPLWNDKFRLRVPVDVAQLMEASSVHRRGITGKGVRVVMVDSGFYHHPYFKNQGYNFLGVTAPDAIDPDHDPSGHGTGECANLFATSPGINFIGVKLGGNSTLAFKTATALRPEVITNSWGYSVDYPGSRMPNYLKPLHLAVLDAVSRGITVCFAGGNGHLAFPANVPEVIAVGGVHVDEKLNYEASNYASSFDSTWFPGRHVPDICGLVGLKPRADYIALPVENLSDLDKQGGWGVFSGTSAACPMVAGVCALLKEADPNLTPSEIKSILQHTARDIDKGTSSHGDTAETGWDKATGYGLVNATRAIEVVI